jgi:hypothetical protein
MINSLSVIRSASFANALNILGWLLAIIDELDAKGPNKLSEISIMI